MKGLRKVIVSLLVICLMLSQTVAVFADKDDGQGYIRLIKLAAMDNPGSGTVTVNGKSCKLREKWNYSSKTYKCKDGGFKIYTELAQSKTQKPINETSLNTLTTGAKNQFLQDYYNAGQSVLDGAKANKNNGGITDETGTMWLEAVQNTSGVGSQLMTTLMSKTKPDYVTANRIYEPFSGTVGTILGIIAILIMAFLAITMVLDLAYIAIPAFQLVIDGDSNGQGGGGKKKSFISQEAIDAVQMAVGGQGGGGQNGDSSKLAVAVYFKKRVIMLVVLGICLLYLVSGNIFNFVGWFIDLLSGFLGF